MNDTLGTALAAIIAVTGTAYAAINDIGTLQDVLIGIALGTLIRKFLVRRLERRSGSELPAARVRQIEITWILTTAGFALALNAILALT